MFASLLVVASLVALVRGANSWAEPCHSGHCAYDIQGAASGTLHISGSPTAISDLTPASGWVILTCDPDSVSQDIRAVCQGDDLLCEHVYLDGAEGTIVRLPDDCGSVPFARLVLAWHHDDQSVPPAKRRLLYRRDGSEPVVKGFRVDTNYAAIDPSEHGSVNFSITGVGQPAVQNSKSIQKRDSSALAMFESVLSQAIDDIDTFDDTLTQNVSPITFNESATLFDKSLTCPSKTNKVVSVNAGVTGTVNVVGQATLNYSVAAAGTVVPPDLAELGIGVFLDGFIDGTVNVDASLEGSIETDPITVFTIGIPGLDFSGIFTIGPTFNIEVQAQASLEADLSAEVDLGVTISNASAFIPSSVCPNGTFNVNQENFDLGVDPTAEVDATLTAHIIPAISFGISVFDSEIEGALSLNFDSSMSVELYLTPGASINVNTAEVNLTSVVAQLQGCADLDAGINSNIGVEGDFLDFFDLSDSDSIFEKDFDLFQKCFGNSSSSSRRSLFSPGAYIGKRSGLSCPKDGVGSITPLFNETA